MSRFAPRIKLSIRGANRDDCESGNVGIRSANQNTIRGANRDYNLDYLNLDGGRLGMLGHLFDPHGELLVTEQCRPHWAQSGAVVFVTFRTKDSIPREVVQRWESEQRQWLERRGVCFQGRAAQGVRQLPADEQTEFHRHFNRCREKLLDNHLGQCLLKDPRLAEIIAGALLHFDGERYRMGDFVIMPNHVHLLCAFADAESMRSQFDSWLHWTATQINRRLGRHGSFWQHEPFDHLVRSPKQYEFLRRYIRNNPTQAGLSQEEFWYRKYEG